MAWEILVYMGAPAVVMAAGLFWFAWWIDTNVEKSRSWSTANGTITHSKAFSHKGVWRPRLSYSYEAQGRALASSRYCFGGFSGTRDEVMAIIDRMPVGATVPVYYDPTRPKAAVLDRSGQATSYRWVAWIVIAVFVVVAVVSIVTTPGS